MSIDEEIKRLVETDTLRPRLRPGDSLFVYVTSCHIDKVWQEEFGLRKVGEIQQNLKPKTAPS